MYAIIESCGKQYKVVEGDVVFFEKLDAEEGKKVTFDNVVLVADGEKVEVGAPYVKGFKVERKVLSHGKGKKIVVVDDSIVRGTTSKKIVKLLRDAGAKEIHMRISAPPTSYPCYYGIDTPTKKELISNTHTEDEIRRFIGADTLGYISLEGMKKVLIDNNFCFACFTGQYPINPADLIED